MKKILLFIILLFGVIFVSGCDSEDKEIDIYTSIYPVEFIVKEIVGDRFTVKSIYPRGMDVHDYEPTPKDMIKLTKSKMIFYIGIGLEAIIDNSKETTLSHIPTIPLANNLTLIELNPDEQHSHDEDDDHSLFYDQHVWLDLGNMRTMASTVLESLIEYLELTDEEINEFTSNANDLKTRFNALDEEFYRLAYDESIVNKTMLVDHDAYAYWGARYGIERIRMRTDNESSDISPKEMQEKIALAKQLGIKYIVTTKNQLESSILPQYLNELGLSQNAVVQIHALETISNEEEKEGKDYFTIMRENLEVLNLIFQKE